MNKHRAMSDGEAQAEEEALSERRAERHHGEHAAGRMRAGGMTAGPAPRVHPESRGGGGREEKVVGNKMTEICQNLCLL